MWIRSRETMKKVLQKYWAWAFVVIPLLLQAIFFYVPMFQGAFYSFTNWTGLTYNYKFVGLNNFKLLFMDPKFMNAIGFTAIITIAMVVGEIALGIFIARVLNSKIKGQTFFRAWFFFPAVLSGLTVALIFKQVFNYGLPAIGNALHIEFLQTSLLGTKWGAIFAAVFVLLWQGVAMPIIIFLAGLQSIPSEITEAARIDGATSKQVFWNIELPYLLPSVSMVFILALKGGLTAFDQVFAMTGGGPNNATTSLGLLVYNYAFKNNQFGYANAIAVILFFLIVVISIIQLRVSKKFEI
ncbi:ABC transporter permease subunit [Streptococcus parasanguinis]|uniref:ABC transporter permease subunit n=2 Tax=Streptococcus TaxID=1301 RepID=A0A6L6LD02_STRPA|nr:ABC transporter permease subunit [Streptococcus parasanguinis]MTR64430.1 ABC transporter permease subunit [Streptococcus parasanguinis]MTR69048.1 ABC transporter permease subunit [Streptococcus parasanguinis]MTS04543.1 ABC transporter permease subunit [Streptococcus parasanguinis]